MGILQTTAQKAAAAAQQHLGPGEQIVATGFGTIGQVSFLRQILTQVVSLLVTFGTVIRTVRARKVHYVLTNQRLFALDGESILFGPGKLQLDLPLKDAKVIESRKSFWGEQVVDLAVDGQEKPLRITFRAMDRQAGEYVALAIETRGGGRVTPAIPASPVGYGAPQAAWGQPSPQPQQAWGSAPQPPVQAWGQPPAPNWGQQQPQQPQPNWGQQPSWGSQPPAQPGDARW